MPLAHAYLTHLLSGPQVSANLKLSEKQEVKKELVSGEGEGEGARQLPFLVLLSSGALSWGVGAWRPRMGQWT